MNKELTDNIKYILIGTFIALLGGALRVLFSIKEKEGKKLWEHAVTLLIVVIVGLVSSYIIYNAGLNNEWYSAGILFVLGYGYDVFLKLITKNAPKWIDGLVKGYLENRYGIDIDKDEKEDKTPED